MFDRKQKNAEIFRDTERRYKSDKELANAVELSKAKQSLILESDGVTVPAPSRKEKAKVIVSAKRSLQAAQPYAKAGKKVCVHNFASATNPGGGVVKGSSAQEECICRCTTLYPCLNSSEMWNGFYDPHRAACDPLNNSDCIYTPDVVAFKSDTDFPEPLDKSEWWKTDILTCAAPNLREKPSNSMNPRPHSKPASVTPQQLKELLTVRIRRIFEVAAANGADVLILGAFGCGAFRNPPQIVAQVFAEVMQDFLYHFETIEYAVFHTQRETTNYDEFKKYLG